ncbi:YfhD family protein [Peribacillus sp. SCS-155]|uniref:YfhD family protein n=1 Tax=Peribacillus sedimenti TaxID=3115297 RepID=UPI0039066D04
MGNDSRNEAKKDIYNRSIKRDGLDIEFSEEFADQDDVEAQARSAAADERARKRQQNQ